MTYEDFKKIYDALAAWRAERRLTVKSQIEGLIGNILEELAEVARAKNNDEKVGELCDIAVFAINAMDKIPNEDDFDYWFDYWMKGNPDKSDILYYTYMAVDSGRDLKLRYYRMIFPIAGCCFYVIERLGYDPAAAMSQTIQKINSRRGAYDETLKKWVKDTSEEAKAQWFTPDYALCRVEK